MKEDNLNFLDRFLYKLLIAVCLLLAIVFCGKIKIINTEGLRAELGQHFNVLKVLKSLNGKNNLLVPFEISDEVTSEVSMLYSTAEVIADGYRIKVNEMQGVETYTAGIVVQVLKNNDKTYRVTVKGLDDFEYVYDKLKSVNCGIYKIIKSGEVIGIPSYINGENYYNFYIYDNTNAVNLNLR